jgi:hypothetical protein
MKNINELCKVLCKRTVPPTFPFQEEVTCSITLGVVVAVNNQLVAFWELPSVIESHLVHGHILSQRQSASNDWLTSVIMAGLCLRLGQIWRVSTSPAPHGIICVLCDYIGFQLSSLCSIYSLISLHHDIMLVDLRFTLGPEWGLPFHAGCHLHADGSFASLFYLFFWMIMEFVLGILCLQSKNTTFWPTPSAPFTLGYFSNKFLIFLPELASNCSPPDLYLLSSWDYRH